MSRNDTHSFHTRQLQLPCQVAARAIAGLSVHRDRIINTGGIFQSWNGGFPIFTPKPGLSTELPAGCMNWVGRLVMKCVVSLRDYAMNWALGQIESQTYVSEASRLISS